MEIRVIRAIRGSYFRIYGNSSANSSAVALLDLTISDPPTQAEVQAVVSKLNELILALRR